MAKNLLLEIGIEEIPARFMEPALAQMAELTKTKLKEANLAYKSIKTLGTPRRLTLIVEQLAEEQPDITIEVKGPAQKAAYDAEGNPTKALQGFCRSQGFLPENLTIKELNGVPYVYAAKEKKGEAAVKVLPKLLVEVIHKIYFPKPMRWGYEEMRFARPIRWIVSLFGEEILPLELAKVKAGRVSRGHRFLGSQQLEIKNAAVYEETLAKEYVIVDQNKRKVLAWQSIQEVAAKAGMTVKEDKELLDEVTYLLEYPTALMGNFSENYLDMPEELIVTPMREHQRYFPVFDKAGKLLNHFIAVRNGNSDHLATVQAGNEKVLQARLADAAFFWQEDCQRPLEENLPRLENIVFHEKLGTLAAKVQRVAKLAAIIAAKLAYSKADQKATVRAAQLMKCDLVSHAVYEFTELQGTMGKYYAQVYNEEEQVALAIEEHYQPRFAGDVLPETKAGQALAMADRIDSLVGFFGQEMFPTGSQDPYAMRRQAMGVAQIIIKKQLDLSISELFAAAYDLYDPKLVKMVSNKADTVTNLVNFFKQRIDNIMTEEGAEYDVVNSVLSKPFDKPVESHQKAMALQVFRSEAGFAELIAGFTRAANLLKNANTDGMVKEALLNESSEKALYEGVVAVEAKTAVLLAEHDYLAALQTIGTLRPLIDDFFNQVMVMAEDEAVRNNRLALLAKVVGVTDKIGDLAKIVM